ncbi:unnamed protein product [Amoebophrya sp. A25]|nr:unnamed protein product [Amoebophrya sp. A25]|eukprot:GSA25T00021351001.1
MRRVWVCVGSALCAVTLLAIFLHIDLYLRHQEHYGGAVPLPGDSTVVEASNRGPSDDGHHSRAEDEDKKKTGVDAGGQVASSENRSEETVASSENKNVQLPNPSSSVLSPKGGIEEPKRDSTTTKKNEESNQQESSSSTDSALLTTLLRGSGKLLNEGNKAGLQPPHQDGTGTTGAQKETQATGGTTTPVTTAPTSSTIKNEATSALSATTTTEIPKKKYPIDFDTPAGTALLPASVIGVVVMACRRSDYLERTLNGLFEARRELDPDQYPIVVSQDCLPNNDVSRVVEEKFGDRVHGRILYEHAPIVAPKVEPGESSKGTQQTLLKLGYAKIANHFKYALEKTFSRFWQAIFLEDDLQVAPDFFGYFRAALPYLLDEKSHLFCVSAWNDQGLTSLVEDAAAVHRTEIFPGLGWMATRKLVVDELLPQWPPGYWDEFMRKPEIRKDRQCLRPEINRVWHFGFIGESRGQFSKYWTKIRMNDKAFDWQSEEMKVRMQRAGDPTRYEAYIAAEIGRAKDIASPGEIQRYTAEGGRTTSQDRPAYVLRYRDLPSYLRIASVFQLMPDMKENNVRGSYRHVLPFFWEGNRIYLVRYWPKESDRGVYPAWKLGDKKPGDKSSLTL